MIFPDQSPVALIAVLVALLAVALIAAARDLARRQGGGEFACPKCGLAFDAHTWAQHNERALYHGRYTVTPTYVCPRCGQTVHKDSS